MVECLGKNIVREQGSTGRGIRSLVLRVAFPNQQQQLQQGACEKQSPTHATPRLRNSGDGARPLLQGILMSPNI